ncbi:hypothetical protein ACVWWG_007784 [Bradyrhizobium sp. LB7.2]
MRAAREFEQQPYVGCVVCDSSHPHTGRDCARTLCTHLPRAHECARMLHNPRVRNDLEVARERKTGARFPHGRGGRTLCRHGQRDQRAQLPSARAKPKPKHAYGEGDSTLYEFCRSTPAAKSQSLGRKFSKSVTGKINFEIRGVACASSAAVCGGDRARSLTYPSGGGHIGPEPLSMKHANDSQPLGAPPS